jgi:hypothetical protein
VLEYDLLVLLLIYLPILRRLDYLLKRVLLGRLHLDYIFRDLVVVLLPGKIAALYIHNPVVVDSELYLYIKVFDAGRLYLIVAERVQLPSGSSIELI